MEDLQAVQHILDLTVHTAASYGISEHEVRGYIDRHSGMHWMQRSGSQVFDIEVTLLMVARLHQQGCHDTGCTLCGHLRSGLIATLATLREAQNAELERRLGIQLGASGEAA
ncbi:hypothetical protein ACQP2F_13285 [Actinoplanes sp. CA-030573]|uniref:hypothetical protein n=1 Tax=Actinoplanes sp. CA-030573 TaxID=3239898 RepID=UPI003D9372CE